MISWKYTDFLLSLRYTFLILSIIFGIIYLIFFFKMPNPIKTFEHKYIALLSISLILFNDPFYAITIYNANGFLIF